MSKLDTVMLYTQHTWVQMAMALDSLKGHQNDSHPLLGVGILLWPFEFPCTTSY